MVARRGRARCRAVCGPDEEERILEALASALDGRGEACLVSVVGGSGGVGASTLSVALALVAQRRGLRSLLFDADPLGGGLDLVLGSERAEGLRWHDFDATRGRLSAGSLADVLPVHHGSRRCRGTGRPRRAVTSRAVGADSGGARLRPRRRRRPAAPRRPRRRHRRPVGAHGAGGGRGDLRVGAARHVLDRLQQAASSIVVVSVARPGGIGPAAVADALGQPVLTRHRVDRRIRAAVDRGHGPGRSRAARRTASALLDTLGLEKP